MKKDFFTFILVPHSPNKRIISFRMPGWALHLVLFLIVSSGVVFVSSVVYSSHVTRKLISYEALKAENQGQNLELKRFSIQTAKLTNTLDDLTLKENKIRGMLGLNTRSNNWTLYKKKDNSSSLNVREGLSSLDERVKDRKISLEKLMSAAKEFRSRFAYMPSIWPVYGRLMSTFGFRVAPWRGLHAGVDIDANYGDPVKAAAGGVIAFAGWRSGYGKTVIIDHKYGFETLYGHLSGYSVVPGQKVEKGQRVAFVGMTGYATGSHLHYEVIKNGNKINPVIFLNYKLSKTL